MKTLFPVLAVLTLLGTGTALAGEGHPNPIFPGNSADIPALNWFGDAGSHKAGAKRLGSSNLIATPEPAAGANASGARLTNNVSSTPQHQPDFDLSPTGPYSRN